MKKALAHTRVTVKLRKSEYHDEWYLYIEAYPVFQSSKDKPQRLREYLNRTITTPVFDKSRNARTGTDGKTTYKPKRDLNGIIVCYAPAGGRYRHLYSKQDAWSYQCTYNSNLCKGY